MATALTATVEQTHARVLLNLTWTTVTSATVWRVHPDGSVWPVRGAEPTLITSTTGVGWVGYDHEAPLDVAVTYQATSTQEAGTVAATPVTVLSDTSNLGSMAWLTHPLKPSLSRLVMVTDLADHTTQARTTILPIIGSRYPIAMSDVRLAGAGELQVMTENLADTAALAALLADGQTLLLRAPATWDGLWAFIAVGDVSKVAAAGHAQEQARGWRIPYTVVASPAGIAEGAVGVTYNDLLAAYATYNAVIAGEATYNAVLTDPTP